MRAPATSLLVLAGLVSAITVPASAGAASLPVAPGSLTGEACKLAGQVPAIGAGAKDACEAIATPLRLPEWLVSKGWGAVNSLLGEVPRQLAGAVQRVIEYGANTVLNGVSGWIASGAVYLVSRVAALINQTTTPQVTSGWFRGSYATLARTAFTLALPLLLFAVGRALFLRDLAELARSVLVYLPLAALLTAGALAVTQMALVVTDSLSAGVAGLSGEQAHAFFARAAKGLVVLAAGSGDLALPGFVVAVIAVFAAILAFVLWLELVVRAAAIYVVLVFLPLAFVALVWPATARVARRTVELLGALIASKLAIVTIVALGAAALLHGGLGGSLDVALAGVVLMGLAVCAPWTLMRLIPLMEAAVAHQEPVSARARAHTVERLRPAELMKRALGESSAPASYSAAETLRQNSARGQRGSTLASGAGSTGAAAGTGGALVGGAVAGAATSAAAGVKRRTASSASALAASPSAAAAHAERSAPQALATATDPALGVTAPAQAAPESSPRAKAVAARGGEMRSPARVIPNEGASDPVAEGGRQRAESEAPSPVGDVRVADLAAPPAAGGAPPVAAPAVAPNTVADGAPMGPSRAEAPPAGTPAGLMAPAVTRPGDPAAAERSRRAREVPVDPDELIPPGEADDGR